MRENYVSKKLCRLRMNTQVIQGVPSPYFSSMIMLSVDNKDNLGMTVNVCCPNTRQAEIGGVSVQDFPL